jgi:type III restriction enzyme
MELKEYQKETLERVKSYLEALTTFKAVHEQGIAINPDLSIDFPAKAWVKAVNNDYRPIKNGLGADLPSTK